MAEGSIQLGGYMVVKGGKELYIKSNSQQQYNNIQCSCVYMHTFSHLANRVRNIGVIKEDTGESIIVEILYA